MIHISSAMGPGSPSRTALVWGASVSVGLHLLLLWPAPPRLPQPAPGASPIKAELRAPAQVLPLLPGPASELPSGPEVVTAASSLDADKPRAVQKAAQRAVRPSAESAVRRPSREVQADSPAALLVEGDALTRYRLGLASHLGRDSGLKAAGLPGRPVVVELMIVLAAGKAIGVEVVDDGGFATLAARAADRVRQASRSVPVPPELRESPLRVSLGVAFEP